MANTKAYELGTLPAPIEGAIGDLYVRVICSGTEVPDLSDPAQVAEVIDTIRDFSGLPVDEILEHRLAINSMMSSFSDFCRARTQADRAS